MIDNLLNHVTTLAVVLHALLGCCAHHTHHCESPAIAVETVQVESGCAHHSHGVASSDADSRDQNRHDQHEDGEPCDESDCTYLAAKSCDEIAASLVLMKWLPISNADLQASHLSDTRDHAAVADWRDGACAAPLSLRAQTQVWLL